jgi:hypothetical protein
VVREPVVPEDGWISVRRPEPDPELLERYGADRETSFRLMRRLRQAAELLT